MIQPTLMFYTRDAPSRPVLLDSVPVTPDVILLLDTFFHICPRAIVSPWKMRKAGYQDQEAYENFKELLDAPVQDAQDLLAGCAQILRYLGCDKGGIQACFLFSKLSPSIAHMSVSMYGSAASRLLARAGGVCD